MKELQFYIIKNKKRLGPFTIEELKTKKIGENTLVWTDDMSDWTKAKNISLLSDMFKTTPIKKKATPIYKSSTPGWVIRLLFFIGATLPFHYNFTDSNASKIFPKDNLTFSNTFIFQEDVDKLVKRYNNADLYERIIIEDEVLFKKLKEKKIIFNISK